MKILRLAVRNIAVTLSSLLGLGIVGASVQFAANRYGGLVGLVLYFVESAIVVSIFLAWLEARDA